MNLTNENIIISEENAGQRIDLFLASYYQMNRNLVQENIKKHNVLVNEKPVLKSYTLKLNDNIKLINFIIKEEELTYKPVKKELDVVYEDKWIIVVNKERGLLVNYGIKNNNDDILINIVFHYLLSKNKKATPPLLIHRIDKETSGLVMLAKSEEVLLKMQSLFKSREIEKTYFGITYGKFAKLKGKIEVGLIKNPKNPRLVIPSVTGKDAITIYEVIKQTEELSFCKFNIITGRTHQIRVHMKFLNHPLIGDELYGNNKYNKDGLFLHAGGLKFNHPFTKKNIYIETKLPEHFNNMLKKHHLV